MVHRSIATLCFPDGVDGLVDEPPLGVVQSGLVPRHLRNDRLQHGEAVDQIVIVALGQLLVDHPEGVDRNARRELEFGKGAAERLRHVLETATVIDHDRLRADAGEARRQILKEDRFPRTRLARDRHVVVAGTVLERRPELRLSPAPDEQQMRNVAAYIFTLDRCDGRDVRGAHGAQPLHALVIGIESVREHEREMGHEGGQLDMGLVDQVPPARLVERLERSLAGLATSLGRKDRNRIIA